MREAEVARYELRFNEQLNFGVPMRASHADYIMSMALLCHAVSHALASPNPAVIPPYTPEGLWGRQHWADVF